MTSQLKVFKPSGILDGTQADSFREEIVSLVKANTEIILIDFSDVTFMDSVGLGALVMCLKTVRSSGTKLFLCSINEQIKILFELTSMDRVFEIFSSQEELEKKINQ